MKQINVAVVGLSGVEKDKGPLGVGKSCLCNRFVGPKVDDYETDHISVMSQSDFNGRVINNDHYLYWGEVRKTSKQGIEYNFRVVEQTEFIDDVTFQPLRIGKLVPYTTRCTSMRLRADEKLKYICRNQLAIEQEYEKEVLAGNYFLVDGFVCVFDVSVVPGRSIEKQAEFVTQIIGDVLKKKKPVVLVTTKNDASNELYIREAKKICKKFNGKIVMVESSAHENVNIDIGFIVLAQMIDKSKHQTKIMSYKKAFIRRTGLFNAYSECVAELLCNQITDHRSIWTSSQEQLAGHEEWNDFLEIFGQEAGQKMFRGHIKKLKENHKAKKLQSYIHSFANVLQKILLDMSKTGFELNTSNDWESVRNYVRNHDDFNRYFFKAVSRNGSWTRLSDMSGFDNRIPFDILNTTEAETIFINQLKMHQELQERTTNFMKEILAIENKYVHILERGLGTYAGNVMQHRELPAGLESLRCQLFDNIEMIHQFHKDSFLPELRQHQANIQGIAETFIKFIESDQFYCYIMYAMNWSESNRMYEENRNFFQEIQNQSEDKPDLDSIFMQLIQRLPTYKLLLAEVNKTVLKLAANNLTEQHAVSEPADYAT